MSLLVLTIIGPDRPGLVDSIADVVSAHQGNWMESRMAHLGGKFAGILRVSVPDAQAEPLVRELKKLAEQQLSVVVATDVQVTPFLPFLSASLELVGGDRPGIVKEVSHALAQHRVNVEELCTQCVEAPMTGKPLFRATAQLHLPPDLDVNQLRHQLEQVAHDLMVDISLNEATDGKG